MASIFHKYSGTWYLVEKHCMQDVSKFVEWLNTCIYRNLGHTWKISKLGRENLVPSLAFRNKTLVNMVKCCTKVDIKLFCFSSVLLGFRNHM